MGKKNKKKSVATNNQMTSNWILMQLMNPDQKYDVMDNIIEDIHMKYVKLDEEETKALNERFGKVIEKFVQKMTEVDITFKEVFNRIYYTGSFYDGLRITEATEYDLNLVLKPKLNMELKKKGRPPGFTIIEVHTPNAFPPYKDWIYHQEGSNKYFLNANAVRWWLQGVVMKTLKTLEDEGQSILGCQLKFRQSGPAWTLSVMSENHPSKTIDIDLVPVLEFSSEKRGLHPCLKKKDIRKVGLDEPWFAVPKPPNCPTCHRNSWRISFPIQEAAIIRDLNYFKYTLRMVKRVRDVLGINEVASYHIKTLFLLELQKQGPDMWSGSRRGFLFMHMLKCLRKALEDGRIPFLWNENCNLIGNVSKATLENSAARLGRYCDQIDRLVQEKNDPDQLKRMIESLLIPSCNEESPNKRESVKGKGLDKVSYEDGLEAIETLMGYLRQQDGTTQDDINVLCKWKESMKQNKK